MKRLNLKLIRDLLASKWLFVGVALVIFLGVAFFGASYMAFQDLKSSYDYSYEQLNFADFTIKVAAAPQDTVEKLKQINGVEDASGRINTDLPLKLIGSNITVLARVITVPAPSRPSVNDIKIEEGSYFQSTDTTGLLIEKSFSEHHDLQLGDELTLVVNGQDVAFDTIGIVTSPEYIFAAKSRQELLVSPQVFGVIFVPEDTLIGFIGDQNYNEFCVTVTEGASADTVMQQVETALSLYGILDAVPRDEQPSNAALKLDLQEFGEMAEIFPILFLLIGALATYILLMRIVQNQRTQIGLMRALGYSRRKVLFHYLSFALVIGITGAAAGTAAGYFLSGSITRLYISILGLPFTVIEPHWLAMEEGFLVGIVPSVIAGILPALAASKLMPAASMRTPPPAKGRTPLFERLLPFLSHLPSLWKIPFRNIFRNRNRSLSVVVGVAFGVSLILVSASFIDSVDALLNLQFEKIQRYDAQVNFSQPMPQSLADNVSGWSEVDQARPILQLPARLVTETDNYTTVVEGLPTDSDLYGLYNASGEQLDVPDTGIILGDSLEGTLGVSIGDMVEIQTTFGSKSLPVTGFVRQPLGSFGYVNLSQAQEIVGQQAISGILLSLNSQNTDTLRNKVAQELPTASVEITAETEAVVTDLFDLINIIMLVMLAFGAALALVIVSTMVTLSILERRREVATMRTLGESKRRIALTTTIENLMLGVAGLIPGIPLGYLLGFYLFTLFQTDMFSFDLVINFSTYLLAAGLIIIIVLISQIPGIRHMNRLELARVIKEQER